MEMMQDCTHIRQLEGERRLLTWEEVQQQQNGGEKVGASQSAQSYQSSQNLQSYENDEIGNGESDDDLNGGDGPIVITAETKLKSLLQRYPQLKDDLPGINPRFSMLKSPMARVVLPIATLKMMSEQSGMPLQELIDKLKDLIATH